jgi:hypothetical protein
MSTMPGGMQSLTAREDFHRRCDVIEETYEFLLAYAAQGLAGDRGSSPGGQLRDFLRRAIEAIDGLSLTLAAIVGTEQLEPVEQYRAVASVVERDATDSLALLRLVASQASISSQLIDNLNASIHLRALLTDLFVVDEILKGHPRAAAGTSSP